MKITFKKDKSPTGLYAVGNPYPDTTIKLNGKKVGFINAPSWSTPDGKWTVMLALRYGDNWKWRKAKPRFDEETDARKWVLNFLPKCADVENKLHTFEDN